MDNCIFHFQAPRLNAAHTATGRLRLIVSTDSFSLLALGRGGEVLSLQMWEYPTSLPGRHWAESEIASQLSELELLQMPFQEKTCAVASGLTTLIPSKLFRHEETAGYFRLLHTNTSHLQFGYEPIREYDCHLVWAIDPHLTGIIPQGTIRHQASGLIRAFGAASVTDERSVFLNLRGKLAQLAVFDTRNLQFYNTFNFLKPNDLLYFTLLIYDQFRLDTRRTPLNVSGSLNPGSEDYRILYNYIDQIKFIQPVLTETWPAEAAELPPHYWFDLLCT
ncbi:MAG: DUF3822 family protein [Bacteroidota bacterium]